MTALVILFQVLRSAQRAPPFFKNVHRARVLLQLSDNVCNANEPEVLALVAVCGIPECRAISVLAITSLGGAIFELLPLLRLQRVETFGEHFSWSKSGFTVSGLPTTNPKIRFRCRSSIPPECQDTRRSVLALDCRTHAIVDEDSGRHLFFPSRAAQCNGVKPALSWILTSAPYSMSKRVSSISSLARSPTECNGVSPSLSCWWGRRGA